MACQLECAELNSAELNIEEAEQVTFRYDLDSTESKSIANLHFLSVGEITMRLTCLSVFFSLFATLNPCVHAQEDQPALIERLTEVGIELPNGAHVPLPLPLLSGEESVDVRLDKLTELAGKITWQRFSKDNIASPVALKISSLNDGAGQAIGHNIHNAFIAYASLETLRDKNLMEATFGTSSGDRGEPAVMRELTPAELADLGVGEFDESQEGYVKMELKLLNKIIVRGIVHLQKRETEDSFLIYWELDPKLSARTENPEMANTWVSLTPNQVGVLQESAPAAYQGCGGYMCVYATGITENQLLIESRMILHEPVEWFHGSYSLRSKLPTSLNESAKSFRRKLPK